MLLIRLMMFSMQVVVDCPSSGHQQVFLCQKWLADDEGDQLIERDLYESEDMRLKRRPSMFTFEFTFQLRRGATQAGHNLPVLSQGYSGSSHMIG